MAIRNLYDSPKPIKALLDDTNRVILSEFETRDFITVEDGGTGGNTPKEARDNLELIRFVDYSDPLKYGLMPLVAPEKNMVAKSENGKMFYANNDLEWIPFGRISISSEIGGVYNTLADVTNFIFTDGFALELDGTSVRVKLDIVQKLEDLIDVDLGDTGDIRDGSVLSWSVELNKFVPVYLGIDEKIKAATDSLAKTFVELDDVDVDTLELYRDSVDDVFVYYDYVTSKLSFKKIIQKFKDLQDVEISSDADGIVGLAYDINNEKVVTKNIVSSMFLLKRDGTTYSIPINSTYI
jgi:hypothetical protein